MFIREKHEWWALPLVGLVVLVALFGSLALLTVYGPYLEFISVATGFKVAVALLLAYFVLYAVGIVVSYIAGWVADR